IARTSPMQTPEQRRDTAKTLALALALDPRNDDARKLVSQYRKDEQPVAQEPAATTAKIDPLWKTIAWLESPQAGTHGRTLGALLLDVAAAADPDHPRARDHAGESAAWSGWVSPLAAYQGPAVRPRPERVTPETKPDVPDQPTAPPLAEAAVRTVVWQKSAPVVVSLRMQASLRTEVSENPTPLRIGPRPEEGGVNRLTRSVAALLEARDKSVPKTLRVRISCPEYEAALAGNMPRRVSAAAAVLASAAVTGHEPDALVLGEVDADGRLSLPDDFWQTLVSLPPDAGRKLIVPAQAADWLPSLLALEKAQFLLDHEVLLARDLDQLLTLAAKQPAAEIAAATASFADLRQRGNGQDVRDYLANRFVRQRLEELASQAPWHASADTLRLQSAGQRPVSVNRAVLAAELRIAIAPMTAVTAALDREFVDTALTAKEIDSLGGIHDQCREKIDRLEIATARTDQDLFLSARALAASLRGLERSTRARGEYEEVQYSIRRTLRDFALQYETLEKLLRQEESKGPSD
ncbi:MAG TPA: hypothetical protein VLO11_10600, partial [Luteolibacter sp.]|nr:hypothetical protein [Luteolibacter sp.]